VKSVTDPPVLKCPYRMLGRDIRVRTGEPALAELVPDVAVRAVDDLPPGDPLEITLGREGDLFQVWRRGELVYQSPDPDAIIIELETLVTYLVTEGMTGGLRLHAGCADVSGSRALFTGNKASGKTSFLMKLLTLGGEVPSDENVLLLGGAALPVPRKFHLREATFSLLPELAPHRENSRLYTYAEIGAFRFFDPTDLGRSWRVRRGPVDAVFTIESNFGGASSVEPCPKIDMVRHLLFQTVNLSGRPGPQLAELTRFVNDVAAFRLRLGDIDEAAAAVTAVLEKLPAGTAARGRNT
jgi:hypothetical protein